MYGYVCTYLYRSVDYISFKMRGRLFYLYNVIKYRRNLLWSGVSRRAYIDVRWFALSLILFVSSTVWMGCRCIKVTHLFQVYIDLQYVLLLRTAWISKSCNLHIPEERSRRRGDRRQCLATDAEALPMFCLSDVCMEDYIVAGAEIVSKQSKT